MLSLDSLGHPRTGIGYYTEHLCRQLSLMHDVDVRGVYGGQLLQGKQLQSLLDEDDSCIPLKGSSPSGLLSRCRPLIRSLPGAYPLRQWVRDRRSRVAASGSTDCLYHEPNFVPFRFNGPVVVTVHDLSHLRFPEYHPSKRVRFLNARLPAAIRRADLVIADSQFVRQEIVSFFPFASEKVVPVHLGVEDGIRKLDAQHARQVLADYGLHYKGFILSVATLEPRKNLAGLVKAYDRLPESIKSGLPLVLVGGGGWHSSGFHRLVSSVEHRGGRIVLTGRVPRSDLSALLSGSRLFAYPSFYEGFGLPIAEARACGTPILTSHCGAMSEIAGEEAFLADPRDLGTSLENALETMPEHVPVFRFSWRKTAEQTLDAYRSV